MIIRKAHELGSHKIVRTRLRAKCVTCVTFNKLVKSSIGLFTK